MRPIRSVRAIAEQVIELKNVIAIGRLRFAWPLGFVCLMVVLIFGAYRRVASLPVAFTAEIQSASRIDWHRQLPTIQGAVDITHLMLPRVHAKVVMVSAWGSGSVSTYLLTGAASGRFAATSNTLSIRSDQPLTLSLLGGSSEFATADFSASMLRFLFHSDAPQQGADTWYAEVTGTPGGPYNVSAPNLDCLNNPCAGVFEAFRGMRLLTTPPRYTGQGSEGVARIYVNQTTGGVPSTVHDFLLEGKEGNGAMFIAVDDARLWTRDFARSIDLRGFGNGRLSYGTADRPLVDDSVLAIGFGGKPGSITFDGDSRTIRISGLATEIRVDSDDLMPRVIEGWSWWAQALIWSLFGMSGEHTRKQVIEALGKNRARKK